MKNIISPKICKKCAQCCKKFPFIEVSQDDIDLLEKCTGLHCDVFTNSKCEADEEYFLKFKENGDCFFLVNEKGVYSCGVYDSRPRICKNYPAEPLQEKVCDAYMAKFLSQKRQKCSLSRVNRCRKNVR